MASPNAAFSIVDAAAVQPGAALHRRHVVAAARPPSQFPIEGQGPAGSSAAIAHGSLVDFYGGIASRIGDPSLDFYEQMRKEHCELVGCNFQFTSSNYNISTYPRQEWLVVTEGLEPSCDIVHISDSKSVRRRTLARWWDCRDDHEASSSSGYLFRDTADPEERSNMVLSHLSSKFGLLREEVISIVLFTGPMFTAYNSVLSKFPVDLAGAFAPVNFTTTLHVIISAIQKLSVRTPVQSIVYRGTGGRGYLPDCFWEPQEGLNVYGYTEFGVMSMTSSKDIALEYSGVLRDRPHPAVLAFAAGAVDRGANVQELSQFPLEVEFTFPPLSYIQPEFTHGAHRIEYLEHPEKPGVQVPVIYVRVNSNIRTPTLDELNSARKRNHLVMFRSQNRDTVAEIRSIGTQRMDEISWRFSRASVSQVLLASLKDAQHSTLMQDPIKTAFEGFLSVIHGQCEELLSLHEQEDETTFLNQFQHARLLKEMSSVRKWAIAKMLWYIEDERQSLVDLLKYPLHKCYREFVSFCRARLKTEPNSDKRKTYAMFLCQLLGLVVPAESEANDSLWHDENPIVEAVENGISVQDVELMLDAGFEVESTNASGSSLLSIAARFGYVQILELLITRGADVNFVNCIDGFRTPILLAAGSNHLNCLKLLLDNGATPSSAAVQMAVTCHHSECVAALNAARACQSDRPRSSENVAKLESKILAYRITPNDWDFNSTARLNLNIKKCDAASAGGGFFKKFGTMSAQGSSRASADAVLGAREGKSEEKERGRRKSEPVICAEIETGLDLSTQTVSLQSTDPIGQGLSASHSYDDPYVPAKNDVMKRLSKKEASSDPLARPHSAPAFPLPAHDPLYLDKHVNVLPELPDLVLYNSLLKRIGVSRPIQTSPRGPSSTPDVILAENYQHISKILSDIGCSSKLRLFQENKLDDDLLDNMTEEHFALAGLSSDEVIMFRKRLGSNAAANASVEVDEETQMLRDMEAMMQALEQKSSFVAFPAAASERSTSKVSESASPGLIDSFSGVGRLFSGISFGSVVS